MKMKTIALAGAVLGLVAFAGGCSSRYDDGYGEGYYDHSGTYYRYERDPHWRDHRDRDGWQGSDRGERVRVCDADGDNCHWEYRHP